MENILTVYAEVPPVAVMTGYEMRTTFWGDFRVCGKRLADIQDTFNRAFAGWKNDKVYGTELALVLNWLSWYYAEQDAAVSGLYVKLWQKLDGYIMDNWTGENLQYYIQATD